MASRPKPHTAAPGRRKQAEPGREASGRKQRPRKEPERPQKPHVDVTDAILQEVCDKLVEGEKTLREICESDDKLPTPEAINKWAHRHPIWRSALDEAKRSQMSNLVYGAIDRSRNRTAARDEAGNIDWTAVQWAKLDVDTRLKVAALIDPARYGPKSETKITADVTVTNVTPEARLEAFMAFLEKTGLQLPPRLEPTRYGNNRLEYAQELSPHTHTCEENAVEIAPSSDSLTRAPELERARLMQEAIDAIKRHQ